MEVDAGFFIPIVGTSTGAERFADVFEFGYHFFVLIEFSFHEPNAFQTQINPDFVIVFLDEIVANISFLAIRIGDVQQGFRVVYRDSNTQAESQIVDAFVVYRKKTGVIIHAGEIMDSV